MEGTVDSQYPVGDAVWDIVGWRGSDAGNNLKSTNGWYDNIGTDLYGFRALTAGRRKSDGSFTAPGSMTYMWISMEYDGSTGWCRYLRSDYDNIRNSYFNKSDGRTVRCILDCTPQPIQSDAGSDQLNVPDTVTTLAGNTPTSGTGNWAVISGSGGVIADTTSPTSDFSGIANNTYELTWTITTPCGSSTDTVSIGFLTFHCGATITDPRDSLTYATVLIDTMCWMAENLNVGKVIDNGTPQTDNDTIEKYCYHNGLEDSCDVYGGLYQWNEMMQYSTTPGIQGICPPDWHLPTDEECKVLEGTVDSQYDVGDAVWDENNAYRGLDAAKKLKTTSGWPDNGNGTDDYGFSVFPTSYLGNFAWMWTSSEYDGSDAWVRKFDYQYDGVFRRNSTKTYGDIVRCLYDCTPLPSQADAGSDQLNVTDTITTLAGNTPASGTANWSIISGTGGVIADASNPTTDFSGLIDNTYELTWTITTPCGSSTDTVSIGFVTFTCGDLLTDPRDSQTYSTVLIDTMCWMAENLNVGLRIDVVNDQINNDTIEKYCYDNEEDNCNVYGGLYQWDEMMQYVTDTATQGICPNGWHIPTDWEWKVLEGTVDSDYPVGDPEWDDTGYRGFDAGYHLKSTTGWDSDGNGDDSYGFTALPGGYRHGDGFNYLSSYASFWSSTKYDDSNPWFRYLYYTNDEVYRIHATKTYGRSVRCLQD